MSLLLGDLLAMIRQDYLDTLLAAAAEAKLPVELEPEVVLQEIILNKNLFHDLKVGPQYVEVLSEGVFGFPEPICFGWGDELPGLPPPLRVEIHPFAWDDLLFELEGARLDLTPLTQWLQQWAAPLASGDAAEPKEVVHGLWHERDRLWRTDLGTAPLEAWQDLLEAVLAAGAHRVTFGRPEKGKTRAKTG